MGGFVAQSEMGKRLVDIKIVKLRKMQTNTNLQFIIKLLQRITVKCPLYSALTVEQVQYIKYFTTMSFRIKIVVW